MRSTYPAWAHVVPTAAHRPYISVVLAAAAVGAVGGATVVLSLASDRPIATEILATSLRAIVTNEPAAKVGTVGQDRTKNEQAPQSTIEQVPEPAPDVMGSNRPAVAADGGHQTVLPAERRARDDWRRPRRLPTPNHW